MKKIVFTLAALLSMTMAFAEGEDKASANVNVASADAEKYEFNVNVRSLSNALRLDNDTKESVSYIFDYFTNDMAKAGAATGEERENLYKKAIRRNLSSMHTVLNDKQYHEYVLLLNTTLNNRGLNK